VSTTEKSKRLIIISTVINIRDMQKRIRRQSISKMKKDRKETMINTQESKKRRRF
jgi:hypothetical protein